MQAANRPDLTDRQAPPAKPSAATARWRDVPSIPMDDALSGEATAWLQLADDVLELAADLHGWLLSVTPSESRRDMHIALLFIFTVGTRKLRAARHDIHGGWGLESLDHTRSVMDAAFDLGFLLSLQGQERREMAKQYHMIGLLRSPIGVQVADPELRESRHSPEVVRIIERSLREYEGSPGLDTKGHWSGRSRGEVQQHAYEWFDETLGPDMAKTLKKLVFNDVGSAAVHCDPGMNVWLPPDDQARPRIEPAPVDDGAELYGMQLVSAAILLLHGPAARATEAHRERLSSICKRYMALLRD